jgi:hypothetical protein
MICSQSTGGRDQRAEGHHAGGEQVQAGADPGPAEQHHAEEAGFQEEGGQHFVGQQRAGDVAREFGEKAPVGAELVGHDDARYHAHAEVDGKDAQPEVVQVDEHLASGLEPAHFEHGQVAGQADRDCRKQDVKGHRERELDARQVQCRQAKHRELRRCRVMNLA